MALVEVSKLTLADAADRSTGARIRLEDVLQTEIPDDQRLVLVRRMHLAAGASSLRPGQRQVALRSAWQAATDGARHGSEDGAAGANCVWFSSEAEAEAVLLDLLLRGCSPVGWFWKLAAPGWRVRPVEVWLAELVQAALAPGNEARLTQLIARCTAAGAADRLVTALHAAAPQMAQPATLLIDAALPAADAGLPQLTDLAHTVARRAVGQLAAPVLVALKAMRSQAAGVAAVRAILRAQVLRVSPALTVRPMLLAEIIARADGVLGEASWLHPQPLTVPPQLAAPQIHDAAAEPGGTARAKLHREESPQPEETGAARRTAERPQVQPPHADLSNGPTQAEPASFPIARPVHSAHAGLWLVVPALSDLGIRGWLRDHPALLGEHPAALLIQALANRHGCSGDDPALAGLPPRDRDVPFPEWTALWSRALDRWLRRTARRRVHDLARRPGKVLWSGEQLLLTFPLAAADIRLRLGALDRDPGWTDWLGLSIRYVYIDEARL